MELTIASYFYPMDSQAHWVAASNQHYERGKLESITFLITFDGKNWWEKLWRIYGHSPNSPTFPPAKVSLHTVTNLMIGIIAYK